MSAHNTVFKVALGHANDGRRTFLIQVPDGEWQTFSVVHQPWEVIPSAMNITAVIVAHLVQMFYETDDHDLDD